MRSVLLVFAIGCSAPDAPYAVLDAPDPVWCPRVVADIAAPRPELHYSPQLAVIADVVPSDPSGKVDVAMIDDLGESHAFTSFAPATSPTSYGYYRDTWWYNLSPNRRYELTVSACCDGVCSIKSDPQRVEFFTSPQ